MKTWVKALEEKQFNAGKYSQSYQDDLIETVFSNVKPTNATPYCIEFGFNTESLTVGTGVNVARLIIDKKWEHLLLDGGHENPEINLHKHFLTSSNITEIFGKYNVPKEPEYISIDVDSTDLWLFDAIVSDYRAMLFSIEYNANYPLSEAITFPDNPDERWEGDRGYGASLKALNMVAMNHGYSLLWVVPRLDAFFIRNDLIDDGSEQISFPFEKCKEHTQLVCHLPLRNKSRVKMFLDYETYLESNGDLAASQLKAYPVCKKYLTDSLFQVLIFKIKVLIPKRLKDALKKIVTPSSKMN